MSVSASCRGPRSGALPKRCANNSSFLKFFLHPRRSVRGEWVLLFFIVQKVRLCSTSTGKVSQAESVVLMALTSNEALCAMMRPPLTTTSAHTLTKSLSSLTGSTPSWCILDMLMRCTSTALGSMRLPGISFSILL